MKIKHGAPPKKELTSGLTLLLEQFNSHVQKKHEN